MNTTASFLPESSWSRRCSTETVFSIQGRETDYVQDSSDSELESDEDVEYEPVTESEGEVPIEGTTSGQSDDELISKKVVTVSVDGDDGDTQLGDSESSLASDSEQEMPAYWSCARCRNTNENTRYRYCDKCFKLRKNFFPPRPRRKTKRESTSQELPLVATQDSGIESLHSQDLASPDILSQGMSSQDIFSQGTGSQDILSEGMSSQDILSQGTNSSSENILSQGSSSHNIHSQGTSSNKNLTQGTSSQDILSQGPSSQETFASQESCDLEGPIEIEKRLGKLKRRSESADRTYKRPRLDSESDCESNRSSKVEVAPLIKTISDPAVTVEALESKSDSKDLCIICFNEPKSGVFVHRRVAHICCCYNCAVKVWSKARRCPICNCKVSNVLKAVVM